MTAAQAQDSGFPDRALTAAEQSFTALGELAGDCVQSAGASAAVGGDTAPCQDLLAAIDGQLVRDYLRACDELIAWRSAFVAANAETLQRPESAATELKGLVRVEYLCGDSALQVNITDLAQAFALLRGSRSLQGGAGNADMHYRSRETVTVSAANRDLQQDLQLQTQRLWDQLQLELLRQQQRRPLDYGQRLD